MAVLRKVWDELFGFMRLFLRPSEQHMAEDFMQEASVDFTQKWRMYGEVTRDKAAAMLKQAARCDVINHRNGKSSTTTSPVAIDDEVLLAHADPNSEPEILAVLGRVDHEQLLELLPRLLTERQRQIIVAVDVEGLTQARAAEQLDISVRGLQKARDTALARLRHYLTTQPENSQHTPRTNREVAP